MSTFAPGKGAQIKILYEQKSNTRKTAEIMAKSQLKGANILKNLKNFVLLSF